MGWMGRAWSRVGAAVLLGAAVWGGAVPAAAQGKGGANANAAEVKEARQLGREVVALYQAGKYDAAIPLAQRALAATEKALGPENPEVGASINNLALLYSARGEYGRAEALYQRALALLEKVLGPMHPEVAACLDNLAQLYTLKWEPGRAEPLYRRAIAIREKALGPDHPEVAVSLGNLASLYQARGEHGQAEPLYLRALSILEKALGPDHPNVASALGNLADLYRSRGEYGRAESLHLRALAIKEKVLGPDHPAVATSLGNLSVVYWASGKRQQAIDDSRREEETRENVLRPLLATGPEVQKVASLRDLRGLVYSDVTLALETRDPRAESLALLVVLRIKGRALDAMAGSMRALRARLGPEEQELFDELQAARAGYVALTRDGPGKMRLEDYRRERERLNEKLRQLEDGISRRSEAFRTEEQPITVSAAQAALGEGTALVEWTEYAPFNPKARSESEKVGPRRYAASVLPAHATPRGSTSATPKPSTPPSRRSATPSCAPRTRTRPRSPTRSKPGSWPPYAPSSATPAASSSPPTAPSTSSRLPP